MSFFFRCLFFNSFYHFSLSPGHYYVISATLKFERKYVFVCKHVYLLPLHRRVTLHPRFWGSSGRSHPCRSSFSAFKCCFSCLECCFCWHFIGWLKLETFSVCRASYLPTLVNWTMSKLHKVGLLLLYLPLCRLLQHIFLHLSHLVPLLCQALFLLILRWTTWDLWPWFLYLFYINHLLPSALANPAMKPKLVSLVMASNFEELSNLLTTNILQAEHKLQLLFDGHMVLTLAPKRPKYQIEDITICWFSCPSSQISHRISCSTSCSFSEWAA